jgi:hypothetical protein
MEVTILDNLNGVTEHPRYRNYLDEVVVRNEPEAESARLSRAWLEPPREGERWGLTIELAGKAETHEGEFDELVVVAQDRGVEEIYIWDVDHSHYEPLER